MWTALTNQEARHKYPSLYQDIIKSISTLKELKQDVAINKDVLRTAPALSDVGDTRETWSEKS